jgi:hypothetical protein
MNASVVGAVILPALLGDRPRSRIDPKQIRRHFRTQLRRKEHSWRDADADRARVGAAMRRARE